MVFIFFVLQYSLAIYQAIILSCMVKQYEMLFQVMDVDMCIPQCVVPDQPLPGLTVSPPHCDPQLMHSRQLSDPTVHMCML